MVKTMETIGLKLSETEVQMFGQIFNSYDSENSGIISQTVAKQVLISAQLEPKLLDQIIELSGCSRHPVLSRHQFYVMLKLVGAAQSGLPISTDTLNTHAIQISLPQLSPMIDTNKQQLMAYNNSDSIHQMSGHLPPPPTKPSVRSNRRNNQFSNSDNFNPQTIDSTNNCLNNNSNNCINNHNSYEQNESTISRSSSDNDSIDSPIDPMVEKPHEYRGKSWSKFNDKTKDKPINWADFDEEHHLLENDDEDEEEEQDIKSNVSSDDGSDIWGISEEQIVYYSNQFKAMQSNLNGIITGNKAKDFFEKSNLPIQELSQIWQMSDIDRDGALTLNEFCIAMHLVVLRRNHIQLPSQLPQNLLSAISIIDVNREPSLTATQGSDVPDCDHNSLSPKQYKDLNEIKAKNIETLSPQNKQWTKFTDSPTNQIIVTAVSPPSTSSSAGIPQSLANFDFNKASISRDPKILHPVALRLSPDGQPILYDKSEAINTSNQSLETGCHSVPNTESFRSLGVIHGKKSPPPPPPPRPAHRSHARSSSLDLNRTIVRSVATNDLNSSQIPIHLKVSNSEYGLTVPQKGLSLNSTNLGAFHAYKKNMSETSLSNNINYNSIERLKNRFKFPPEVPIPEVGADTTELWQTIRSFQEYCKVLLNISNDLLLEVIKANEDNNSLERQLTSDSKL